MDPFVCRKCPSSVAETAAATGPVQPDGLVGGGCGRSRGHRSRVRRVASLATYGVVMSIVLHMSNVSVVSPQAAAGSPMFDIKGKIETAAAAYAPANVATMYLCFAGYQGGSYQASACRHRTQHDYVDNLGNPTDDFSYRHNQNPYLLGDTGFHDDGEPDNLWWPTGLNAVDLAICLTCCSNSGCVDDDYDEETGFCKDHGYNDKWRIECDIDRTQYRQASKTGFKNHQMRFLRSNTPDDSWITHCAIPRWGYTYKRCDPDAKEDEGGDASPRCPKTWDEDPEPITCDGTNEYSWCNDDENPRCSCTVPEGYYYDSGGLDSTKYFVGYELRLWVKDENNGEMEFWRSVQKCEVTTHEWSIKSVEDWEGPEVYFKQHIHIMTWPGYDHFAEENRLVTLVWIFVAIVLCVCTVSCIRDSHCVVCQERLIVSWILPGTICPCVPFFLQPYICQPKGRCLYCIFYNAEPPDPSLLNVLRSREEHLRGKPFRDFLFTGVRTGRNKVVGVEFKKPEGAWVPVKRPKLRKVYVAPKAKEIDSPFALQKPPPRQKPQVVVQQNW